MLIAEAERRSISNAVWGHLQREPPCSNMNLYEIYKIVVVLSQPGSEFKQVYSVGGTTSKAYCAALKSSSSKFH